MAYTRFEKYPALADLLDRLGADNGTHYSVYGDDVTNLDLDALNDEAERMSLDEREEIVSPLNHETSPLVKAHPQLDALLDLIFTSERTKQGSG